MRSRSKLSIDKTAALLLSSLALAGVLLKMAAFWRGIGRARRFAAAGRRFERRLSAQGATVLILGDSTGVGIGATLPEESIAGLLAADYPDADIVNVAVSGTRAGGAIAQARRCLQEGLYFDLALLHVGGNDVVADTPLHQLAEDCDTLLQELGRLAVRTVWLGPPNLGLAPLFPRPYAWLMASRSRAASQVFSAAAARHHAVFVNFSAPAHVAHFRKRRREHFAIDGFHPNSVSYKYGYTTAREMLGLQSHRS
ncbi:MAG TPA: GDSL-type esterase/lipase family protein [Casimicrobiaceae bacterium]|jgi:lysophospholipase L1-like esterase